jgi:hypothetical protein
VLKEQLYKISRGSNKLAYRIFSSLVGIIYEFVFDISNLEISDRISFAVTGEIKNYYRSWVVHILKGELPIEQIESAIFKPTEEKDLVNVSALVLESVISILSLIILLGIPWVSLVIWFNYISYTCPYLFKFEEFSLKHF